MHDAAGRTGHSLQRGHKAVCRDSEVHPRPPFRAHRRILSNISAEAEPTASPMDRSSRGESPTNPVGLPGNSSATCPRTRAERAGSRSSPTFAVDADFGQKFGGTAEVS